MLVSAAVLTALLVGSGVGAAGGQTTTPDPTIAAQADTPVGYASGLKVGKSDPQAEHGHQLPVRLLQGRAEDGRAHPDQPRGNARPLLQRARVLARRHPLRLRAPTTGIPNSSLVTIDLTTGSPKTVGDLPQIINGGMTFDGEGNLWLYTSAPNDPECGGAPLKACLWEVDPATAKTKLAGSTRVA